MQLGETVVRKCGATWTDKIWHITEGYLNPSTTYAQGSGGEGAGYVLSLLTLAIFLTFNESYKTVHQGMQESLHSVRT